MERGLTFFTVFDFLTKDKEVPSMRTVPIFKIIQRYGLTSRRLSPKNRIKYEDAINSLKGYENADMAIDEVIDNCWKPNKSISHNCQIPGCGQRIRYEYVLKDKRSAKKIVVGSTCVWPTLGFSELDKKQFDSLDKAVREHGLLVTWKAENPDIVDKLNTLRAENLVYFRAFWEEIEYCRLTDEDTEFIRNVDVQAEINKRNKAEERRKKRLEARKQPQNYSLRPAYNPESEDDCYKKVVKSLETLYTENPGNHFYYSLMQQSKKHRLSDNQIYYIKRDANRRWYEKNIKGTAKDCMSTCDDVVGTKLNDWNINLYHTKDSVESIDKHFQNESEDTKMAWRLYKVKNGLVFA